MTGSLKSSEKRIPLSDWDGGGLGRSLNYRDVDPQESVQVRRLGLGEIVTGGQFENALEGAIVDLHYQETAFGRAAAIGPRAADAQLVAFDGDFEMVAAHAGQLDFDDETAVGHVDICVGDPTGFGRTFPPTDGASHKMHRRTNFAHGHFRSLKLAHSHQNRKNSYCFTRI